MKIEITKRIVISVAIYIFLFILGTILVPITCPHTFHVARTIPCEISFLAPEIAGIVSGAYFGWKNKLILSMLSVIVPIIGLIIIFVLGYLEIWYGSDISWALWFGVIHTILPTVLASVLVSRVSNAL